MAEVGAWFSNPDTGQLTLSSDGMNYRYIGAPTLVSTATNDVAGGNFFPAVYSIDVGAPDYPPVVAVIPQTNIVTQVSRVYQYSGNVWRIEVYCQNVGSHTESMREVSPATPQLRCYGPMIASGVDVGCQLWNANGRLTFDSGWGFLFSAGSMNEVARQGYRTTTTDNNFTYFNGDTVALPSGITTPAIITGAMGYAESLIESSGQTSDFWGYGWRLNGSNISRYRVYYRNDNPSVPFNASTHECYYWLAAQVAHIVDLALV